MTVLNFLTFFCMFCMLTSCEFWNISSQVNPFCDMDPCNEPDFEKKIVYFRVFNQDYNLDVFISTFKYVSMTFVHTLPESVVSIDWKKILNDTISPAISYEEEPLSRFSVVFQKMYQGVLESSNLKAFTFGDSMQWKMQMINESEACIQGFNADLNGTVEFIVRLPGDYVRQSSLPHLTYTPKSVAVDFSINVNSISPKTFYALEVGLLSMDYNETACLAHTKTVNDERMPGIFHIWRSFFRNVNESFVLQWKPAFFLTKNRSVTEWCLLTLDSTSVRQENVTDGFLSFFKMNSSSFSFFNVSFRPNIPCAFHDFISWSFVVGYDIPFLDKMSTLTVFVISFGLGAPTLGIVFLEAIYRIREMRRRHNVAGYNEISE